MAPTLGRLLLAIVLLVLAAYRLRVFFDIELLRLRWLIKFWSLPLVFCYLSMPFMLCCLFRFVVSLQLLLSLCIGSTAPLRLVALLVHSVVFDDIGVTVRADVALLCTVATLYRPSLGANKLKSPAIRVTASRAKGQPSRRESECAWPKRPGHQRPSGRCTSPMVAGARLPCRAATWLDCHPNSGRNVGLRRARFWSERGPLQVFSNNSMSFFEAFTK